MSWGFPPKYITELNISSREKALVLVNDSIQQLGWKVSYIGHHGIIAYTKFSLASFGEEISFRFDEDKVVIKSECVGLQLWDWGRNEKNIHELVGICKYLSVKTTEEEIHEKYAALEIQFSTQEEDALKSKSQTTKQNIRNFFSLFLPMEGYFVTPLLVNLNILLFILMCSRGVNILHPSMRSLIQWGANFKPVTLAGEWWRLFTCCFLHIGVFHLLMNMFALVYVGRLLEPYLGRLRFLSAYLLAGFGASLASLWWNNAVVSAGASGAIFGMYGVFCAMLTTDLIEKSARRALQISIFIFVGYNLLNGLKDGVDNAAHVGGLLTGLLIGYAFYPSLALYTDRKSKMITVFSLSVFLCVAGVIMYSYLPYRVAKHSGQDDLSVYQDKIQKFVWLESMALEVYRMPRNSPKAEVLSEIKDRSLYHWNSALELIQEADKLKIPARLHERNRMILEYCNLRIGSMNLLYKMVDENRDDYSEDQTKLNAKIQAIMGKLKRQ